MGRPDLTQTPSPLTVRQNFRTVPLDPPLPDMLTSFPDRSPPTPPKAPLRHFVSLSAPWMCGGRPGPCFIVFVLISYRFRHTVWLGFGMIWFAPVPSHPSDPCQGCGSSVLIRATPVEDAALRFSHKRPSFCCHVAQPTKMGKKLHLLNMVKH